ncbi:HAD-IA family hydrolase [Streptomyces sp. N2-109]|uniref:HAD-IA family hydrolase n=1 Tax=Streptomyces gossypii TaxID=2883101 RepID=A0ABT2JRK7_9ACTN|nr:HAD-IA family hydrolase [Streptomyces gossypii]MCT2590526.1 HAD-IA family hydrolase [Streptomyces gossypii]
MSSEAVATLFKESFRDVLWSGRIEEDAFWEDFATACGAERPSPSWREILDTAMGAMPAVHRLPVWAQHAQLTVISNHRHEWLLPRLDATGALGYIDAVYVSSSTGLVKPDPAAYAHALRGTQRSQVLYVDDQLRNATAAAALGLHTVLADGEGRWLGEVDSWLAG